MLTSPDFKELLSLLQKGIAHCLILSSKHQDGLFKLELICMTQWNSNFPSQLTKWLLRDICFFWLCALSTIFAICLAFWLGTEAAFRITGGVLQLAGVLTVFFGIQKTRKLFGLPLALDSAKQWWLKRPRLRVTVHTVSARAVAGVFATAATGLVTQPKRPLTTEERVNALEEAHKALKQQVEQLSNKLETDLRQQKDALTQEQNARSTEDQKIRERLELAHTGGLSLSGVGAVWLFVGVILSTFPPELAR
jgi:hypothetical protein